MDWYSKIIRFANITLLNIITRVLSVHYQSSTTIIIQRDLNFSEFLLDLTRFCLVHTKTVVERKYFHWTRLTIFNIKLPISIRLWCSHSCAYISLTFVWLITKNVYGNWQQRESKSWLFVVWAGFFAPFFPNMNNEMWFEFVLIF